MALADIVRDFRRQVVDLNSQLQDLQAQATALQAEKADLVQQAQDLDGLSGNEGHHSLRVQFWPIKVDGQGCCRASIFPSTYLRERGHTAGIPAFMVLDGNGKPVQPLPGQGLSAVPPGQWLIAYLAETIDREADAIVVQVGSHKWQHDWLDEFVPDMPIILETDDAQHEVPAYNPGRLAPTANKDVNRRLSQQMAERAELVIAAHT